MRGSLWLAASNPRLTYFAPPRKRTRKSGSGKQGQVVLALAATLFFIWLLVDLISQHPFFILGAIAVCIASVLFWLYSARQQQAELRSRVQKMIDGKLSVLRRRKVQLVTADPYGKVQNERWEKELDYFVKEHLIPCLGAREVRRLEESGSREPLNKHRC